MSAALSEVPLNFEDSLSTRIVFVRKVAAFRVYLYAQSLLEVRISIVIYKDHLPGVDVSGS